MTRWANGRVAAIAIPAMAGMILLLLAMWQDRPVSPADAAVVTPPPDAVKQSVERPGEQKNPVALSSVSLPPPPPAAKAAPKVEEAVAKVSPPPVEEIHALRPAPPVQQPPAPKIGPLRPKAVETPRPAPKPEPVRRIVPLQAKHVAPVEEPTREITPMKASTPKRAPEPVVETSQATVPELPDQLAARAEASPKPAVEPDTVHVSVTEGGTVAKEGRALLRLLEHGSGPSIEIAWPSGSRHQERLYQTLARCYGMRTILMDGQGNLYVAEGRRSHKWDLNLDRFSGFVRQPAGFIASEERSRAEAIRRYHALGGRAGVVRIFPRAVDAVLLGGLQQILGNAYRNARSVHAVYRLEGDRLFVENIERDGMPISGRIAFASLSRGACRG